MPTAKVAEEPKNRFKLPPPEGFPAREQDVDLKLLTSNFQPQELRAR
jgi:hypothetical protein